MFSHTYSLHFLINLAIQAAVLVSIQLLSLSSAAVQLKVGIYNSIPDLGNDDLASYKNLIEDGFNDDSNTVDAVVDKSQYDPYGDLKAYLSDGGFDMIEMDTANLQMVYDDDLIIEIPSELPSDIMPAAVSAVTIGKAQYGYPTLLCGNFLIGLDPPGTEQNCPLRNARENYDNFHATMENCKLNVGGKWRRIHGGKMNDDSGWYLPFLYIDGYIDSHDNESVQQVVYDVINGVVDSDVCERLTWYIGCCDDRIGQVENKCYENFPGSYVDKSSNLYTDIKNGETAFYFGFSEQAAQIERGSKPPFYAAISGPLGQDNYLLQFTDALVINKARWNVATEKKRNAIIDFVKYFLSNDLRTEIAMGHDIEPPRVPYLLPATKTFYESTTDSIYKDLFWSLERAVAAPSLSDEEKSAMQENLQTLCIKPALSEKTGESKQEL